MAIDVTKQVKAAIDRLIGSKNKEAKVNKKVEKTTESLNKDYLTQKDILIQMVAGQKKMITQLTKMSSRTKKVSDNTLLWTKHTRILGGSLAVLRSKLLILSFGMAMIKKSIDTLVGAYAEFEAAQKRVESVLKSTNFASGQTTLGLTNLAAEIQNSTGISDSFVLSSSALLATFTKIGGETFPSAQKAIVDMTAAMNAGKVTQEGLKSSTIQVGKALNDPIKGLTALSRVGVAFTKNQKDLIKLFVNTNQVAKAQAVILKELNKEFGGTASADTYEKAVRKLASTFGDFQKEIGVNLRPVIQSLAVSLEEMIKHLDPGAIFRWVAALGLSTAAVKSFAFYVKLSNMTGKQYVKTMAAMKVATISFAASTGIGLAIVALGFLTEKLLRASGLFADFTTVADANAKSLNEWQNKLKPSQASLDSLNASMVTLTQLYVRQRDANNELAASIDSRSGYGGAMKRQLEIDKEKLAQNRELEESTLRQINLAGEEFNRLQKLVDQEETLSEQVLKKMEGYKLQTKLFGETNLVQRELLKTSIDLFGINAETGELNIDLNDSLTKQSDEYTKLATSIKEAILKKEEMAQTMMVINQGYATMGGAIQLGSSLFKEAMDKDLETARQTDEFKLAQKNKNEAKMEQLEKNAMAKTLARRQAMFLAEKALAASRVILDYTMAEAKGFSQAGPIFGIPLSTLMKANMFAALGLIAAQTIAGMPKFAKGGDFVTTGPQMIMVGDNPGGRERVQVTPLSSPNAAGPQGVSQVTVNVSGNVMTQEFVEGELAEQIREAVRRGEDFGLT